MGQGQAVTAQNFQTGRFMPCSSAVLKIIDAADFDAEEPSDISVFHLAEAITGKHSFAKDAGGLLHVFRGGCYRSDGSSLVHQQVRPFD
jgi:hypothetical protein